MRYRALEDVYAVTIKHVGTTFALLAAQLPGDLKDEIWQKIFQSSGLGGWLDAADAVCQAKGNLSPEAQQYCSEFSDYRRHGSRDELDNVYGQLDAVLNQLKEYGYKVELVKSLNIRRALRVVVQVRNKCAHGSLEPPFFASIEANLYRALKSILTLIPFSKFVLYATYGNYALKFVEQNPTYHPRRRDQDYWFDSDLLPAGYASNIPFLFFREDSNSIYFLNGVRDDKTGMAEYIDYLSGQVRYRELEVGKTLEVRRSGGAIRPRSYQHQLGVLSGDSFAWKRILLTKDGVSAASKDEAGVYTFISKVNLGNRGVEVVLYVGKTESLRCRLESYVRILLGYDDSRPEISRMFENYGENIELLFAGLPKDRLAPVERAIYETTMPEYNLRAPPAE